MTVSRKATEEVVDEGDNSARTTDMVTKALWCPFFLLHTGTVVPLTNCYATTIVQYLC